MTRENRFRNWIMDIGYIRDGELLHTDESLILALLLHAKSGEGRKGKDMTEVQRIMKDHNLAKKKNG